MRNFFLFILFFGVIGVLNVHSQCANSNTLLANYNPLCDGNPHTATNCIKGGQYLAVNVTAGNIYTFSTCGNTAFDTQITLYNNSGGPVLGYNDDGCGLQSTITWTATFTGVLRVLINNYPCSTNAICIPLIITCTQPPPPPPPNTVCLASLPDDCSTACNLGALPAPAACTSGQTTSAGASVSFAMTNIGSTAGNPYSTISGCAIPASDVWYRFQATGTQLLITLKSDTAHPLNTPNISLYNGSACNVLLPLNCFTGSGGNLGPVTYSPITPGDFYYLQISGATPQEIGNWVLTLQNNYACSTCLLTEDLTVTPPPVNGTYAPGTTVNFCFKVSNYNQTAANWLHGVDLNFGPGWDLTTLAPTSIPPSCATTLGAYWGFYLTETSTASGLTWGPGFFYETSSGNASGVLDNNPGDNFGDVGVGLSCPITFCWHITTKVLASCIDGASLNVAINTTGDYQSGSWSSVGCNNDPIVNFNAVLSCCPQPIVAGVNSTCGLNNGSATATGQGVNAPWMYTWTNSLGVVITTQTVNGSSTISNLAGGQYFVTVVDNNNCSSAASVLVGASNVVGVTTLTTGPYCIGDIGDLVANPSGGAATYSWSGPNGFTSALQNPSLGNVTMAMAGNYTVTATFAGGCTATSTVMVVVNSLPVPVITPANPTICSGKSVQLKAAGGTIYTWSNGATTDTTTVSPLSTTTYLVTVLDINGCSANGARTVNVIPSPAANISPVNVSICAGTSATLIATGGTSYHWSNGINTNSITVTPPVTTTYTVTVTAANGCSATATKIVTVNSVPVASISPATLSVCSGTDTMLTASGGTTYSWSNGANTASAQINPLANTTYTVTVSNGNCTATASRTVSVLTLPPLTLNPLAVSICYGTNTTLTAGGGANYIWSNSAVTNSINVSPLSTTTYTVTATNANNCSASLSATVSVNPNPLATITPLSVTICNGTSTTLNANGGISYVWSNSASTNSINVSPGATTNYTVTVTDANSCSATATATVNVNQNPVTAITPANVSICFGSSTTLTASGGTGYNWSNAAISNVITVSPGATSTYSVTVTDGNNCSSSASTTVTVNPLPTVSISPASATICNGTSLVITVTGGNSYLWSNTYTASTINVTPSSTTTYTVTATDLNLCSTTAATTITVNQLPVASISVTSSTICNGTSTTLTATGGTNYLWSSGANTSTITVSPTALTIYNVTVTDANLCSATATQSIVVNQNPVPSVSPSALTVCAGFNSVLTASGGNSYVWSTTETTSSITVNPFVTTTYTVTATDLNGCTASATSVITVAASIAVSTTVVDETCFGGTTGAVNITVVGGQAPLAYHWSNGAATQNISSVAAGNYQITVTDNLGCAGSASAVISEPPQLVITETHSNVLCNGGNTGSVTVSANGGMPGYSFIWNDGNTSLARNNLSAGNYQVTVTDNNACTASNSIAITQPAQLAANETHVNVLCNGGNSGSISITAAGGTIPYSYLWNDGNTSSARTSLNAGNYSVVVTDSNLCTASVAITLTEPSALNVSETHSNVLCYGGNSGAINLSVTGGTPSYTFMWNDGATTQNRTTVTAGNYSVTTTDNNLCSVVTSIIITEPLALNASETHTNVLCHSGTNGSINIVATNGTAPYSFIWNDGNTLPGRTNLAAGNYNVTVSDNNLCSVSTSVNISEPLLLTANEMHTDVLCNGGNTGTITIAVAGGTIPYSYAWDDGITSLNRNAISAGNYTLTITDNNLCNTSVSVTISEPLALSVSETHQNVLCYGGSSGSAIVAAAGGTQPYSVVWNDNNTLFSRNNLQAGNYSATVSDGHQCTANISIVITEPPAIIVLLNKTDVSCHGFADGTITSTVSGGTPTYTYVWSDNQTTLNRNNLLAANYVLTVTDNNSCTASASATISEPNALAVTANANNITCNGYNDGTVTLAISGGIVPYSYFWNDGSQNMNRTGLAAGNYSVTIHDAHLCTDSTTASITEPPAVAITSTVNNPSCERPDFDGSIAIQITSGFTPFVYHWSNNSSASYVTSLGEGVYSVTVNDAHNCSATATFSLLYQYNFSVSANPSVTIHLGETTTLNYTINGNAGNYNAVWSPASTLSCADCVSPVASPYNATLYQIEITNNAGCKASDTVSVQVIDDTEVFIPNAFSPNGDGNNDVFQIYGRAVKQVDLRIFNRWGEEVFSTNYPLYGWDGTYKGELQSPGVFVYDIKVVFLNNKSTHHVGSLSLLR
jgi:gliding motility-associated-like protein